MLAKSDMGNCVLGGFCYDPYARYTHRILGKVDVDSRVLGGFRNILMFATLTVCLLSDMNSRDLGDFYISSMFCALTIYLLSLS